MAKLWSFIGGSAKDRQRAPVNEAARLEAFLRASPIEYCGWNEKGDCAVSPGLTQLLGIGVIEGLEDIQAAITAGDAAALEGLYDRLHHTGDPFNITVHTVIGNKTLRISGRRGISGGADKPDEDFSVLWFSDISDFAEASLRSMEAVAHIEKRENDLKSTINALPFPLWLRGERLDITWCNKAYARAIDDTTAAVVSEQKFLPLTSGDKGSVDPKGAAQTAIARQAPEKFRSHAIVSGQRKLLEITESPLSGGKGLVGVALDVTQEEEWEQSCKRLVISYHEAMEQLRTAIAMFDKEAKLEFYNSAYEQLTGLSAAWLDTNPKMGEIIDRMRELRKLPEQADYRQYKQTWAQRFTSLLAPHEEMQYLPDGTVLRMIVVPRPMGGLLLTMEDVTSHLQLETSLNTLLAVQQETIDNLSEGIAVFGEDGRLKLANNAFRQIWGLMPEDVANAPHISKMIERAKKFFSDEAWPAARQRMIANGLERDPKRGRFLRTNGTVIEYAIVPLPDGNVMNTYFDITSALQVEEALHAKNAALEEAEQLKKDFLANVSYQLRTPLNAMMGFAEILNQQYFGALNERQLEYTVNMIEAGQRLVSLINDILDLSSIEAGYLKLYPSEINLDELMERVAGLTSEWARKQRIDLAIECPENLIMSADERRLKQVLLNLLSNAFNYSPDGGQVTLSAKREGESVVIGVRDTGMGIPATDLKRVFTPFDRIGTGKADRRSGAGLGLTLVKSIVELHGGTVAIESQEGKGTLVACRLPLQSALESAPAA